MDPMQTQIPAQAPSNPYNLVGDAAIPVAPVQVPVEAVPQVQISISPVAPMSVAGVPVAPAVQTEGFLEKMVKGIVRFIAKASGNPDPFTGAPAPAKIATPVAGNIPAPQSTGIFGQIGDAFSGMAQTAQGMVQGVVDQTPQAPVVPAVVPPISPMPPMQEVPQIQPAPQAPVAQIQMPQVAPMPPIPPQA